jgi:hypothetical protein
MNSIRSGGPHAPMRSKVAPMERAGWGSVQSEDRSCRSLSLGPFFIFSPRLKQIIEKMMTWPFLNFMSQDFT